MTIEQKADAFISNQNNLVYMYSTTGRINLTTALSASALGEQDPLHNMGEYVPFVLCVGISVNHQVIKESFESSLRMFRRGACYPAPDNTRSRVVRGTSELIYNGFFSDNDNGYWYATDAVGNYIRPAPYYLSRKKGKSGQEIIIATAVIDKANFPFIMACKRHNKGFPMSMLKFLYDESLDTAKYPHPGYKRAWKKIKETLQEGDAYIRAVPQKELEKMFFRPKRNFSSFTEIEAEKVSLWTQYIKHET